MSAQLQRAQLQLDAPITAVRSIGARASTRLAKLGITTVRALLWHLPSRYEDYSQVVPIGAVQPDEKQSIHGTVVAIGSRFIWPRRMTITTATIGDESGSVRAVWFNQPYLEGSLPIGTAVSLAGKVVLDKRGLYFTNPAYEKIGAIDAEVPPAHLRHTGRLVPVYPETAGVTSKFLRYLIQPVLETLDIPDPLPASIRRQFNFPTLADALRTVHYPENSDDIDSARTRLAFDDLLTLQLKALAERRLVNLQHAPALPLDATFMQRTIAALPFTLTKDQRVTTAEILRDMERPFPMNRLLEGDVGSGKTIVALLAALHGAHHGWQTVILAPTEVLAQQHYRTLETLFGSVAKGHAALLIGSTARIGTGETTKRRAKLAIAHGMAQIIIGTHALLQDDVRFPRLGLVVIDEQHRFGIAQRAALVGAKRNASTAVPHLLSMTATPIPRTLALTIFGDLDISLIREKPSGRQSIVTTVVRSAERAAMYEAIREQMRQGRQAFIICPLIEVQQPEGERAKPLSQAKLAWAQAKAVQDEHARLAAEVFPDLNIAMLHGRMKAKEKERVMREFKDGWHNILVSTSVIEVGVDIPNATVMLVEGADRFGLAQLHQFRGRVGRSDQQSYCFLCATDDGLGYRRLLALTKSNDGFVLAEEDMKLRGPGEFFGLKQSGMPDLTMAALADVDLIKKARATARAIMRSDPYLKKFPLLAQQVRSLRHFTHFE